MSHKMCEARRLCKILEIELVDIRYVKEWAARSGCSKKKLQRIIKAYYGITAKEKLKLTRFNAIKQILREEPDITSYGLAVSVGLKNEQIVYKFLNRNFDTSYRELKSEVFRERLSKRVEYYYIYR